MEATLCQIYTLCSLAPPPLVGQDGELDILVRSRIFWSAYVSEGVTSGLRGGRLILCAPILLNAFLLWLTVLILVTTRTYMPSSVFYQTTTRLTTPHCPISL